MITVALLLAATGLACQPAEPPAGAEPTGEARAPSKAWTPADSDLLFMEGDLDVLAVPVGGGDPITLAGGPGRQSEGRWRPAPNRMVAYDSA